MNININPKIDFSIHEFEYKKGIKIILIKVLATAVQPVSFKGIEYIRVDSNKTRLKTFPEKERKIWSSSSDWSEQIIETLSIDDLDSDAVTKAKSSFKQRSENKPFYKDIDSWSTETFLDKAKITVDGKITNTAVILLGKSETKRFINNNLLIVWVFIDEHGLKKHSEIFEPPFFLAVDTVLNKLSNEKIKILSNKSVIPIEKTGYPRKVGRFVS